MSCISVHTYGRHTVLMNDFIHNYLHEIICIGVSPDIVVNIIICM